MSANPQVSLNSVGAWKYSGYKKNYSCFVESSRNFFITRKFRTLDVRIILAMQDQLAELQEGLNNIDNDLSRKEVNEEDSGFFPTRIVPRTPRSYMEDKKLVEGLQ